MKCLWIIAASLLMTPIAALSAEEAAPPYLVGVGVYLSPPSDAAPEGGETTIRFEAGRVFSVPLDPSAFDAPAAALANPDAAVSGVRLSVEQDTTLGFTSYLNAGMGLPTDHRGLGLQSAPLAYELSAGLRAALGGETSVDLGYAYRDGDAAREGGEGEDAGADASHDFIIGVRRSF